MASSEQGLWAAVLLMAIKDCTSGRGIHSEEARDFIFNNGHWFSMVCDMAGVSPWWVRLKLRQAMSDSKKLLRLCDIGKRIDRRGI